jgi:hypothetical protein
LETLVVADMKFLQDPNSTDYEQYLFTTVNMASGIIHNEIIGHQLHSVLGLAIYLEKQEEETTPTVNRDTDVTGAKD